MADKPYISFDGFPLGLVNRGSSLNAPEGALKDGQNVILAEGGLKTRPGSSVMSTGSLPAGEIMAMTQFRSPTTEQSYVVAQVKYSGWAPINAGALWAHSAVWDSENSRVLVFGGRQIDEMFVETYFNSVLSYTPATDTWETLTTSGDIPDGRGHHTAVYSPVSHEMVVVGGLTLATWNWGVADVYSLNCDTLVWTLQAPTGVGPEPIWAHGGCYNYDADTIIISGGRQNGSLKNADTYFTLDLATWVWSKTVAGGGSEIFRVYHTLSYIGSDTVLLVGGCNEEIAPEDMWSLDLNTHNWTGLTGPGDNRSAHNAIVLSTGNLLIVYGEYFPTPTPVYAREYDITLGTWSDYTLSIPGNMRYFTASCIDDTGAVYICGGHEGTIDVGGGVVGITVVLADLIVNGGAAPERWGLYACDDHLPTTTGVFEQIYEFTSTPGVCTFGPLNDRLVITEGVSDVPLVWGGALAADASDWMHVLHCLIAQDGVRFYTVSDEVCDKDPDTVAQIGGIRRWGWIAFCTDMPTTTGFYIDVETPNTGAEGTTTSTFYEPIVIDDAADVERQDLRATITNWVQSAGATGHFTDGAATVTLGPGNTNEDFVPGLLIKFADAELIIIAIVGDGSGADSVTLSDAHASAAVTAAYGTTVDTTGLSVVYQTDVATTAWSNVNGNYGTSTGGYSVRQLIPASAITTSGDHIQITLKSCSWNMWGAVGFGCHHVAIVERDTGANGTTAPTEITFNGGQSGCGVSELNTEITSDLIPFTLDETKSYLIIMDFIWSTYTTTSTGSYHSQVIRAGFPSKDQSIADYIAYIKDPGWGNEETSYNLQTVSGFSANANQLFAIDKIEVATLEAVPSNVYVAHTTDATQVLSGVWESMAGIAVDALTPGASLLCLAVSFDYRATFWTFEASAWRQIVRENAGTWQYNDSATAAPNWVAAAVDSLLGALREAFTVAQNQMTKAEFEAVTEAQWQGTGGFIPHITTTLDFACAMAADGTDVPRLSGLTIQYADAGQSIMQVWKNGAWTDVPGDWTDDTIADGNRLGQSGIIGGTTEETGDYHVLDGVPGHWWRLLTNGTSPTCAITRVRYQAPCQPLANIGDGQPEIAQVILHLEGQGGSPNDISVAMADNTLTAMASAAIPMDALDYLYIGYSTQFNEIEATPYSDAYDTTFTNNAEASVLAAEYWNGEAWVTLTIADGTDVGGATLSTKGKVTWTLPSDWKTSIPFDVFYSRGYWVRLSVSAALTATSALSELRVYGVPDTLVKHNFVASYSNRIALGNTQASSNRVDISAPYTEYQFTGAQAGSFIVGAQDSLVALISAWDGLLAFKTNSAHFLKEGSAGFESVEAARHVPINSQVVVKAPVSGLDAGDRYGLFFINRYGVFVSSGLHTDSVFNTSRGKTISDVLSFWDTTGTPRIDLNYLHLACGEYWPARNWIVWAVPLILTGSSQTTNNALIVWDLTMQVWLPPFVFPFGIASMTTAYHYNANAPQKLGDLGLYAGDYTGTIYRLFDPALTTDASAAITGFAEWGYLGHGQPDAEKFIRKARFYGLTNGSELMFKVSGLVMNENFTRSTSDPKQITGLSTEAGMAYMDLGQGQMNKGNLHEYRVDFDAYTEIDMIQVQIDNLREKPAT